MRSIRPRLSLLVVLALGVVGLARGQVGTSSTTAPPPEAPRPPLELGPDVPRGAMARFMNAAREGRYAKAAEFLNLRQLPSAARARQGPELARELEAVLDRTLWVDLERLSAEADGDPDDGLPALRDSLGTIETNTGPVEVLIERVPQPGGPPVWKIAATTVAAIPALYEDFGWGPLANVLPAPFFELRFLDVRLWQWIALVLLFGVAWTVARVARALAVGVARTVLGSRLPFEGRIAEHAAGPLQLVIGLVVFATGVRFLALSVVARRFIEGGEKALAIVAVTWFFLRALDLFTTRVEHRFDQHRYARAMATVPLVRRTLKVFVAIVALIAALQNFGFNVTGLIAGLGVGGLAVALAAQKTVENLFGSVSLIADQPVRVGDVCRFGETVGTVEDIGLRSTRVRTVDRTLVTIPNAQFSTLPLENLSRRDRIPVRATLTLPQGTDGDRVRTVLGALREMLAAEPKVHRESIRARFVRMGPQVLELEFVAFVLTSSWDEFVDVREKIFLRALDIVAASGAEIR